MSISLKNYTLKYLATAFLVIIAIWATLFYTFVIEEVYDNIDDGLKNLKIQIIRQAYIDEQILEVREFDFNQYRITAIDKDSYKGGNYFRNEMFYMEYEEDYEPYRVLETYFWSKDGMAKRLEIRASIVEEDEFAQNLLIALLVLYGVIVTSVIIINNVVLRKTWKPFYQILTKLRNYQFGTQHQAKDIPTNIQEFKLLNQEIEKMIVRNQQSFTSQKQFIENAAHELQTPMAVAINKLEMIMEDESLQEDTFKELIGVRQTLQRLVLINKSLLTLSRIENNQFLAKENLNFNQVIQKVYEDFAEMMEFKQIRFDLVRDGEFEVQFNRDLAYILISNLFRNAIKYNINGGIIQVCTTPSSFVIQNSPQIEKPLDKELIFNRFYKSDQDNTSS